MYAIIIKIICNQFFITKCHSYAQQWHFWLRYKKHGNNDLEKFNTWILRSFLALQMFVLGTLRSQFLVKQGEKPALEKGPKKNVLGGCRSGCR